MHWVVSNNEAGSAGKLTSGVLPGRRLLLLLFKKPKYNNILQSFFIFSIILELTVSEMADLSPRGFLRKLCVVVCDLELSRMRQT